MKKLLKSLFAVQAIIALFAFSACSSDSAESSTISVDTSNLKLEASGQSQTFSVQSNTNWTIIGNSNWVQVSPASGSGNKAVVVNAQENTTTSPRSCVLNISTDDKAASTTVLVEQAGTVDNISVDVNSLTLEAKAGSTGTIRITSNTAWKVTSSLSWLSLSSTSGNGSSQITLTTTSDNLSSSQRKGNLTITAGQSTINVTVSQNGLYAAKCKVKPTNILPLSIGFAFDLACDDNVTYYQLINYHKNDVDKMTDAEILEDLINKTDRCSPSDGYIHSFSTLYPETDYVICTVGFNKNGEHGDIIRTNITTKKLNNIPFATISNVKYEDPYFKWTTTPNGFVKHYYQFYITNSNFYGMSDAAVAWFCKRWLDQDPDSYTPILKAGSWYGSPNPENQFHVVAWAVGGDDNLAGYFDRSETTINEVSSANKRLKNKKVQNKQRNAHNKYKKSLNPGIIRIR